MKVDNMVIKNLGIYRWHLLQEKDLFTEANIKGESEPKQDQAFYLSSLLLKCFTLISCIYNRIIQYGKKSSLISQRLGRRQLAPDTLSWQYLRLRVGIQSKVQMPQLCDICL
jgi:hypothetical protein